MQIHLDESIYGRSVVAPTLSPFDEDFHAAMKPLVYERLELGDSPLKDITGMPAFGGIMPARTFAEADIQYVGVISGGRIAILVAWPVGR